MGSSEKTKLLVLISDIDRSTAFEDIITRSLNWSDFEISYCFISERKPATLSILKKLSVACHWIKCKGKLSTILTLVSLILLIRRERPAILHAHLFRASLLGMIAASLLGVPAKIVTRHHSLEHHIRSRKGVLSDKLINKLSDRIVSISGVVTEVLIDIEKTRREKIVEIPHGFDLLRFKDIEERRVRAFLKRHKLCGSDNLIGVISRFVDWKGIEYIIDGFRSLKRVHKNAHLVLMNAFGPYTNLIHRQLGALPDGSYTLITFDYDIPSAYAAFDVFVHAPVDPKVEAFGQVYIEALASRIPCVFTISGIASQVVIHGENALVVNWRDSGQIFSALKTLLDDKKLRMRLTADRDLHSLKRFSIEVHMEELKKLYMNFAQIKAGKDSLCW